VYADYIQSEQTYVPSSLISGTSDDLTTTKRPLFSTDDDESKKKQKKASSYPFDKMKYSVYNLI